MALFDGVPLLIETPQQMQGRWEQGQQRFAQGLQFAVKLQEERRQFNELLKLRQQGQVLDQQLKQTQIDSEIINQHTAQMDQKMKLDQYREQLAMVPIVNAYTHAVDLADSPDKIPSIPGSLRGEAARVAESAAIQKRLQLDAAANIKARAERAAAYSERQRSLSQQLSSLTPEQRLVFTTMYREASSSWQPSEYANPEEIELRSIWAQDLAGKIMERVRGMQSVLPPAGTGGLTVDFGGTSGPATNAPPGVINQTPKNKTSKQPTGPSFQNLLKAKGIEE